MHSLLLVYCFIICILNTQKMYKLLFWSTIWCFLVFMCINCWMLFRFAFETYFFYYEIFVSFLEYLMSILWNLNGPLLQVLCVYFENVVTHLFNQELHNLYSFLNTVSVIKSRRMRWLGRPRHRWNNNIEVDYREIGYEEVEWVQVSWNEVQWLTFVDVLMKLVVQ